LVWLLAQRFLAREEKNLVRFVGLLAPFSFTVRVLKHFKC
jgi:hypothetical protein